MTASAVEPARAPVERADSPKRTLLYAGAGLGAGGLALVGTGIAFAVMARLSADAVASAADNRGLFDPSAYSAGRRHQVVVGVLLGVGAAVSVAGATLLILGRTHARIRPASFGQR